MGDLLPFRADGQGQVLELRPGRPGMGPRTRCGLRRGASATQWYDAGCRLEGSDPSGAARAYERALAGCPGLADAHNNLGRLIHDTQGAAAAEASYRLAICADPGVALYWFNLGVALEDQRRHAEAIAAYERGIELDGCTADAHFNLARLLELLGRRAGDEAVIRSAVRHLLRYRQLTKRSVVAR